MRKPQRPAVAVALLALLALAVGACGSDDDNGSNDSGSDEPVVIGTATAETGFFNVADIPSTTMLQFGVDDINTDGGVLDGRQLELVGADTKSDVNQGAKAALQLIDSENADIIFPSVDYDFGRAAASTAVSNDKLVVGGAGSAKFSSEGIGDLLYNVGISTATEGAAMAEYAFNDLGLKNPYILLDTTIEYTKQTCAGFEEAWSELAGDESIAGEDTFKNEDASISTQLSGVRNSDADFVVLCSYNPGAASAVRQIRADGIDLPIVASASMDGEFWLEATPNLSDFHYVAYGSLFGDDPDAKVNELFDRYRETTGEEPTQSTALIGYRASQVIREALEQAGSTEGAELAEALADLENFPAVMGDITFGDLHMDLENPLRAMEITDGKQKFVKLVDPENVPQVSPSD